LVFSLATSKLTRPGSSTRTPYPLLLRENGRSCTPARSPYGVGVPPVDDLSFLTKQ